MALFNLYFAQQNTSSVSAKARQMARDLLADVVANTATAVVQRRDVVMESVELKGYGYQPACDVSLST
jgi:hypothetical protein